MHIHAMDAFRRPETILPRRRDAAGPQGPAPRSAGLLTGEHLRRLVAAMID